MSLPHQGLFQHRSLFDELGEFDLSYPAGADYEFLLRELTQRDALFVPDVTVAACRTGGRSSRVSGHVELLREWRRAQLRHGFRTPSVRWLVAMAGARVHEILFLLLGRKIGARVFDFVRAIFGKPPYWSRLP